MRIVTDNPYPISPTTSPPMAQYLHLSDPDPELPTIPRTADPITEMVSTFRQTFYVPLSQKLESYKTRLPAYLYFALVTMDLTRLRFRFHVYTGESHSPRRRWRDLRPHRIANAHRRRNLGLPGPGLFSWWRWGVQLHVH
jgi:hypothetical protein